MQHIGNIRFTRDRVHRDAGQYLRQTSDFRTFAYIFAVLGVALPAIYGVLTL